MDDERTESVIHLPTSEGIDDAVSTRDIVQRLVGKVDALSEMFAAYIGRKPWMFRIAIMLAENKQGQLKYVAIITLGLAAIAQGIAFSAFGFSIAEAMGTTP